MAETKELRGVGVGDGIAVGPLARMGRLPELPPPVPVSDASAERQAAQSALATVADDLSRRAAAATDPTSTAILEALGMIAADPTLGEQVDELIDGGTDAAHAVHQAVDGYRELLSEAGGYLAERAADLADIRDRVIAVILGLPIPGVPDPGHPFVLAADDLAPADTAGIDTERVLALVTERGGPTSHTAILARGLGLPCVVACAGIMDVPDGTPVGVDAGAGVVEVDVGSDREDALRARIAAVAAAAGRATGPGRTADGHPVALLHNIGSASDLDGVVDGEFEGVGLFRTEFLFLDRPDAPGFDEQRSAYAAALRAATGRKVVLRTLDAGADKPLRFVSFPDEPNPALGVRGLRVARRHPELLSEQLAAIAAAASDVPDADVWVMAPMVATPTEAAEFAAAARAAGLDRIGVMIEVPSAALRAQEILAEVDFLSIGTNDLSQYTFAADRMEGELHELLDPWQPALLELIGRCAEAGNRLDKPVGICGEAAADSSLAPVFAGLGITSLSMAARATGAVRRALAGVTYAECERAAKLATAADTPAAARAAVRAHTPH
jgi:phosphotransferase system enzyme I (PtsI)